MRIENPSIFFVDWETLTMRVCPFDSDPFLIRTEVHQEVLNGPQRRLT